MNKGNEPSVSIIVPMYNCGKYITRCLDSILAQTYKSLEIICVDDGSTDNTSEIVQQYTNDSRVVLIQKKNEGASKARAIGLNAASGSYITFIDADDYIDPIFIEELLEKALEYKVALCFCDEVEFENQIKVRSRDDTEIILNRDELFQEFIHFKAIGWTLHGILFEKSLIRKIYHPSDYAYGEDTLIVYQAISACSHSVYVRRDLYQYEKGNLDSATANKLSEKRIMLLMALRELDSKISIDGYSTNIIMDYYMANLLKMYRMSFKEKKINILLLLNNETKHELKTLLTRCSSYICKIKLLYYFCVSTLNCKR